MKTRNGCPVEIFKWDARGNYPIKGMIIQNKEDVGACWNLEGAWMINPSGNYSLVIVEEVEEPEFWSDRENKKAKGYYIDYISDIIAIGETRHNRNKYNLFATEKQAKSALAMARISQIMANDIENFGGVVTDEEWENDEYKYVIERYGSHINTTSTMINGYDFLAFHTEKQRDLFLEKYPQLVHDFLMITDEETK